MTTGPAAATTQPPSSRPYLAAGTRLVGRYEIRREIGRGGYSAVYAAHDLTLARDVAIKLLVPPPASADIARERMRREVLLVRELSHEHIVPVYDFADDGERSFLVLRLVDGMDLAATVRANGPRSVEESVALGIGIASALSLAHRRAILHRDVKPHNILIERDGRALLTDFGSARMADQATMTQTGALVGTLGYTAPNVLAGFRADARDDVYALGMTLHFALTASDPPRERLAPNRGRLSEQERGVHPRDARDEIPIWLDTVIAIATSPDPEDRFATAEQLRLALESRGSQRDFPGLAGSRQLHRCVVCSSPEPVDNLVCIHCAEAGDRVADTLIVVQGEDHAAARVPSASADAAIDRLRRDGAEAFAVPARLAWTAIPRATWLLILLVAAGGIAAASTGASELYLTTIAVALVVLLSANLTMRSSGRPPRAKASLPQPLQDMAVSTFSELPAGCARALHAALTVTARSFYALHGRHLALRDSAFAVAGLYEAGCTVARDLAEIDRLLDAQEALGRDEPSTSRRMERLTRLERGRASHVQCLLDATTSVRQLCELAVDSPDGAETLAWEMAGWMAREAEIQRDAMREVRELLAS